MITRYIHENVKRNFSISIIWIKGGSNMDKIKRKGINQILCSLLTRGCEGFNNFELSDYIESYGGELNHEVLEDGISISIKSLDTHFKKLFPLINLIVNKPVLSEFQFQKVKKETLNNIKREKENPFNRSFEIWRKIVYSKHPYAFNASGYEEDISKLLYEDVLLEYDNFRLREKYIISNNLEIKQSFPEFHKIKFKRTKSIKKINTTNKENRFISAHNKTNQMIFMLGNQTCPRNSNEFLPLKVLESYLSFGMSSVLFKLFREKNGITYDVGVFNPLREDNAPFLIYLSVSNKNALFAFEILTKLWKELVYSLIPNEKLYFAKEKLKSSYLFSSQSLENILQREVQLISYGILSDPIKEYVLKIDKVSSLEIQNLIKKYLASPFLSITGDKNLCNEIKNRWIEDF